MAVTSTWTVVRDILTADMSLTADQVIAKAKAKGVKTPDADIRSTVHTLRKRLKKKAAAPPAAAPAGSSKAAAAKRPTPAPKPVPAAARQKATPSLSAVVRSILAADPSRPADAVIAAAKTRGVTATDAVIRKAVHNVRSELKKPAGPAPAAPGGSTPPAPAAVAASPGPVVLSDVLSNVAAVSAVVTACGGVDAARRVAEAVRACGGPEGFQQYLDLVAGIKTG